MTATVRFTEASPDLVIRPTVEADVPRLKGVIEAVGLFPADMLDDMMRGFFEDAANGEFWLTGDRDGPVAVAYCAPERMTSGTWNLLLIAVAPHLQSQGVGAAIMHRIETDLAERGERILLVETSGLAEFERTRAFYRDRLRFEEEARIRDFYAAGDDKVVFRKALIVS